MFVSWSWEWASCTTKDRAVVDIYRILISVKYENDISLFSKIQIASELKYNMNRT